MHINKTYLERDYKIKMHLEDLYMSAQHSYKPNSFLGMVAVKEKIADRWGGRGEGEGECPLLHET